MNGKEETFQKLALGFPKKYSRHDAAKIFLELLQINSLELYYLGRSVAFAWDEKMGLTLG